MCAVLTCIPALLPSHALQNNARLPQIVKTAVTVLGHGTRLVAGEVGKRLAAQLHALQGSVPPEVAAGALASLSEKQRTSFNTYLSGNIPGTEE